MNPFTFNTTKSILFRSGAAKEIDRHAGDLLGSKVLLITDAGLRKLGLCDPAISALEAAGHEVTVFDAVEADPSVATLMEAVKIGRSRAALQGLVKEA